MPYYKKENIFRKKIKNFIFTLLNKIDNSNNTNFETNGEKRFVQSLLNSSMNDIKIFDVGANIGSYSEIILGMCHSKNLKYNLHLFEPSKKAFGILESKFSKDTNIFLNNFGVSDSDGEAMMFFDQEGSSLASLYQRNDASNKPMLDKASKIILNRLDKYIKQQSINKIDFLKLDVEGHELFALKGLGDFLNPQFIKAIQFEYGGTFIDSRTSLRDMYIILENKGYVISKIMKNHVEKRNYDLKSENFQYGNFVALAEDLFNDRT